MSAADLRLCANCQATYEPVNVTPASAGWGCLLAFFFVIPGILYWAWLYSNQKATCAYCGATNLLVLGTPGANAIYNANPDARVQAERIIADRQAR